MSKAGAVPSGPSPRKPRTPKLKVKRPFRWTAKSAYKKGDLFDPSKCSPSQLARVAAMRDGGGFFEA